MKKITLLVLSLLLALALFSCNNQSDETSDTTITTETENEITEANPASDFEYEFSSDGNEIYIKRYIGSSTQVVIPSKIEDKQVTQIDVEAFKSNTVTSVQIPNTVNKINDRAFKDCNKLEEIVLSNTLTHIGKLAFENCASLKEVILPSSLEELGEMSFYQSGIERLEIQNGLEIISPYAFAMTNLTNLIIPESVKIIEHQAFASCTSLQSITLNEGLVEIGNKAFVSNTMLKEITIPKTVKTITEMTFSGCSELQKVIFNGDAPLSYEYSDSISGVWKPINTYYTVFYYENAKGFSHPEWYGYPTKILK